DVYMLDLGISDAEEAALSLEELVLDYLHGAVQKVLQTSGADEISLLGQFQGGTLCAMYTSLFPRGPLKNLVLISAPTEFAPRNPGALGLWTLASSTSGAYFDPEIVPKTFGNLPTDLASRAINSMASLQATAVGMAARTFGYGAYDTALRAVEDLADRDVSVRSWLAVSKWVDDAAPFPGEVFRRWVRDFYQRDKLVKGEVELRGQAVNLSKIECAVLNVSGKRDYVVPPSQTEATTALARSSDKESVSLDAGHVGMLAGPGTGVASGPVSETGSCPARVDRGLLASMDLPANPIAPTSRWMAAARAWESGPSLPPVRLPTRLRADWPRGLPGLTAVAGRGRRAWNVLRYEKGARRPNGTERFLKRARQV
ncbi:MAG: alpha/beta fold hydrolase, partial [Actinomycetota bacterium]|nr:alpha/beta fold hydrolase [Actinomycetota bacterium]